jgi:alkylated DNA repair dioxygenase AlkB
MSTAVQESLLDFGDEAVPGAVHPERMPLRSGAWIDVQRGWLAGSAPLFARLAETVPWRAERRRMYDRTVDVPRLLCFYGEREPLPDPALDACRDALNAHYAPEPGARPEARAPAPGLRREGASPRAEARRRPARTEERGSEERATERRGSTGRPQGARKRAGETEYERLTDEGENTGLGRAEASAGSTASAGNTDRFVTAGLCFYRDGRDSVAWHGDTIGRGATEDTMVAILSLGEARPLLLRPRGGGSGETLRYVLGHGDLLVMGGSCQRTWEHAVPKSARPTGPRISVQFRPRGVR